MPADEQEALFRKAHELNRKSPRNLPVVVMSTLILTRCL